MWLIVLVIILIAGLGIAIGFIIEPLINHTQVVVVNNTTQQPAQQTNNTTTSNKTVSSKSTKAPGITKAQAEAIARNYEKNYGAEPTGEVDYVSGLGMYNGYDGDPFYHVELKWIDHRSVKEYGDAGYIEIDAITGQLFPRG